MATHNVRDEVREWIAEQLGDVTQDGALSILGLTHVQATGEEKEIFSMKVGQPRWGKADEMGDLISGFAERHARGVVGQQQFNLCAVFGSSGKASRWLPFGLQGVVAFGPIGGGGLGTEGATEQGMRQQGMRMGEMVVQGTFSQIRHVNEAQNVLVDRLMRRLAELENDNRELFLALRKELENTVQLAHERRMKELEFMRSTEERKKLIRLFPALANAITGREVFPESREDTALIESLCEGVSEDEVKMLAQMIGTKSPELSALIMNRFVAIQKKKDEEAAELRVLSRQALGGDPEADAAGEVSQLNGAGKGGGAGGEVVKGELTQ
jgi:hypothetical protein